MKLILRIALLLCLSLTAKAQQRVAQYAVGKYGTAQYEKFGFWTGNGKREKIEYSYGKEHSDIQLTYLGTVQRNGATWFKVGFPNRLVLLIRPSGYKLQVTDESGKYNKLLEWEYEGPVNGIGTFCDVCAEDEKEALQLIKACFLK